MILFYEKETGKIIGNIEGRIHDESHLRMWIGDKDKTERIVCQWKKIDGVWQPDSDQKDIFISLDSKETKIKDYVVDVETGKLKTATTL